MGTRMGWRRGTFWMEKRMEKRDILVFEKVVRLLFPPGGPGRSSTLGPARGISQ